MANTTEPPSWASIADEFSRFSEHYPLTTGQLPLSLHYFAIGFDAGDRTSRWSVENGSGESARREFQNMAAQAWRKLCGIDHPHAWLRWCDVVLAEAAKDEVHETRVNGTSYPEPHKWYPAFDLPDACRISGRVARSLTRGSIVWQWPSEDEATDTPSFVDQAAAALKATGGGLDARAGFAGNAMPEPLLTTEQTRTSEAVGAEALTFAKWLDAALTVREWDEYDLQHEGGPYWKTTRKILDGARVKGPIFTRVEKALNAAKGVPKVAHEDIERLKRTWRWAPRRKARRPGDGK